VWLTRNGVRKDLQGYGLLNTIAAKLGYCWGRNRTARRRLLKKGGSKPLESRCEGVELKSRNCGVEIICRYGCGIAGEVARGGGYKQLGK